MNEDREAYRIRQVLNYGLQDIPTTASRRLEAARHLAVSRKKTAVPQLQLAVASGQMASPPSADWHGLPHFARQAMAILALLAGIWLSFYWHSVQYVTALEEVDSALLSDDLPPEAFLDSEFLEWLTDDSSED